MQNVFMQNVFSNVSMAIKGTSRFGSKQGDYLLQNEEVEGLHHAAGPLKFEFVMQALVATPVFSGAV